MKVTLYEENHTYRHEDGRIYDSVSHVISKYKRPFNAYQASIDYAFKHGMTPEYWRAKWDESRDLACNRGTAFHNTKELFVLNSAFYRTDVGFLPVHNWKQLRDTREDYTYSDLPAGVYVELTLCNHQIMVAGTADKVIIYPDGTFDIEDYKTNREFKMKGFQNQMMKAPLKDVPDAHAGHYGTQLNIYAWMLAQYGLRPRKLRITHYSIPAEENEAVLAGEALPHIEPTIYHVGYNPRLTEKLLSHYALTHSTKYKHEPQTIIS